MALKGQLSDFNLAEILQLIATQQKSGFLTVEAQRTLVFVFDKGQLISTRDRRNEARDPLRSFLTAYGFFTETEWKNIDYVQENSTLDLTEILLSEDLMDNEELDRVLKSVAQEMAHQGMKLKRGRYDFNPTRGTPPGVRSPFRLDVQGLLMEAARRLDEEPSLKEALPSPSLTFTAGAKTIPDGALSPTGRRLMELALAGQPLGRIIRQGRAESFVVLDLLKKWCDEGFVTIVQQDDEDYNDEGSGGRKVKLGRRLGLRSVTMVLMLMLACGGAGWLRWIDTPIEPSTAGAELRANQVRDDVATAAQLYRYQNQELPSSLNEMVRSGLLAGQTLVTVQELGWKYTLNRSRDGFTLGG